MQKTYLYYVNVYAHEFNSNMIDTKYVLNSHEVDLYRIEGICEKFELIAVVQLQGAAPSAVSYAH
jgi:hypothetical protein